MRLGDYLNKHGLTMEEFAAIVGVDRTTVGRWVKPSKDGTIIRPHWDQIDAICKATDGAVTANDFMIDPPPSSALTPCSEGQAA